MVEEADSGDPLWGTSIDGETLRRLARSWPTRATIRTNFEPLSDPSGYDLGRPDYPPGLLPFADHPTFLRAPEEQRQQVLTFAWLMYNERVIEAEECIVNPALALIVRGDIPAPGGFVLRAAVQQAHIDEAWHSYMHMLAMEKTRSLRRVRDEPDHTVGVTHRGLLGALAANPPGWPQHLLRLAWATVSEATINAYLYLVAQNKAIQPHHSLVARLHARDEAAHSSVMIEACKNIYHSLDRERRQSFAASLPLAFDAFADHDFVVWRNILDRVGVRGSREIVEDSSQLAEQRRLVRDDSGMRRLVRALEIDELEGFDFTAPVDRSKSIADPISRNRL
jgi:hypothetical protein